MIILDTNVLAALMRRCLRHPWWRGWTASQPIRLDNQRHAVRGTFWLGAAAVRPAAANTGNNVCPLLKEDLENRVLDFDSAAATEAASLAAARQKNGRPVDMRDTPNRRASRSARRRASYPAARNVGHIPDLSVLEYVVDPWAAQDL